MKRSMDYGFENRDLSYTTTLFGPDGEKTVHETQSMPIVSGPTPEHRAALEAELAGGTVKTIESSRGDGAVQSVLLNHEASDANGLTIFNMGIGGNFNHPVGTRDVFTLAAANPDQRIMVLNNAGSDGSSLVPREVMGEMKRTGSYARNGEWLLQVLEDELRAYGDKIAFWGNSAGGRVAMGMATAVGKRGGTTKNVRVMDPPGAKGSNFAAVDWKFVSQLPHQLRYRKSPYGQLDDAGKTPANLFTARGAITDNYFHLPGVMGKAEGFRKDLEGSAVSLADGGDFTFITPEYSQFATANHIERVMGRAAFELAMSLRRVELEKHSHTIMSAEAGSQPFVTAYKIAEYEACEQR